MRRAEIDRNRELKKQAELDDLVLEPRRMAEAGEGLESIVAAMQRLGSPIPEADVQAILDDVKDQDRRRAELRSEGVATANDPQVPQPYACLGCHIYHVNESWGVARQDLLMGGMSKD